LKAKDSEILLRFVRILAWAIAYYLVTWFSLNYFLTDKGIAIAWPPVGIFISAILLTKPPDRKFLIPLIMVADFLADMHTDVSYPLKIAYAILSTGDAAISAWILLRFVSNPFVLQKAKNLLFYVLLSIILVNGSFSILVAMVTSFYQDSRFITGFLYSWVADGVGNLMIVPLIISWSHFSLDDLKFVNVRRTLEIFALIILLIALNIILFPYSRDGLLFSFIINYLSFPFIIWAIFRFDMKIVTMVTLLLTSVMLFNLIRHTHVMTDISINRQFVFFQLYVASIATISLLITAITSERNQAHKALIESERNYKTVADYTYAWEYWIDDKEKIRYMSPAVENITGYNADCFLKNTLMLDEIVYPDDRDAWYRHKYEMMPDRDEKHSKLEFRIISKDNHIKWIGHDCRHIFNNGVYHGIRVSNRDITLLVDAERKLLFNTVETEERERNRYSSELHDGLGPLLSTIKMYVQSLYETHDKSKLKLFAEESNNIIKIAIQTMREIAYGISPHNLNNSGYVDAMIDFADRINNVHKLIIDFNFNTRERFSSFYEIILYRITTELINNTIKYAEASHVQILYHFDITKKSILLSYIDDGHGFDTANTRKSENGMGLLNIRQRMNILRGSFNIESCTGKGTRIEIKFPVNEKDIKNFLPK
jgi:PAS domain S-box-containing protein